MENTDPDTGIKKETMLGFIYLQDDEKDYRVGVTSDMTNDSVLRSPDNPRLKICDHFQCLNLLEAESAEQEFLQMASDYQTHGPGWLTRSPPVKDLWRQLKLKHGRLPYDEFLVVADREARRLAKQLAETNNKLEAEKKRAEESKQGYLGSIFGLGLCIVLLLVFLCALALS